MNKLIQVVTALLLVFLSATSNATEIKKGTFELIGNAALSISSSELKVTDGGVSDTVDEDTTTLSLTGAYYVADNIGLGITWDTESSETDSTETSITGIGPAIVLNLGINNQMSFKLLGSFFLASYELNDSFFGDVEGDGYGFTFGGGISYFMNDYVSLNGLLEYGYADIDFDNADASLEVSDVTLGFGLSVYFH